MLEKNKFFSLYFNSETQIRQGQFFLHLVSTLFSFSLLGKTNYHVFQLFIFQFCKKFKHYFNTVGVYKTNLPILQFTVALSCLLHLVLQQLKGNSLDLKIMKIMESNEILYRQLKQIILTDNMFLKRFCCKEIFLFSTNSEKFFSIIFVFNILLFFSSLAMV